MPRYITLNANNKIIGIRYGKIAVTGEIESDTGELGQIMQTDGTFLNDAEEPALITTLEDKINYLYYKITAPIPQE